MRYSDSSVEADGQKDREWCEWEHRTHDRSAPEYDFLRERKRDSLNCALCALDVPRSKVIWPRARGGGVAVLGLFVDLVSCTGSGALTRLGVFPMNDGVIWRDSGDSKNLRGSLSSETRLLGAAILS